VLGSDAAGVVEVAGAQSGFEAGERVFFQGIIGELSGSTFQEKALMPAELVSRTPSNVSDEEAAGVSLAAMAVLAGFYHEGAGRPVAPAPWEKDGATAAKGRAAVVLGGSSSVGQYAVQLARLSGFERIVTASSPAHHDLLRTLGATAVLDRNSASAAQYVEATHGLPLEFVFDSISAPETQQLAVDILAGARGGDGDKARAVVTVLPQDEAAVTSGKKHNIDVNAVFGKGSAPHMRALAVPFSQALSAWLKDGSLVPNRPEVVPGGLAALDAALDKNRSGISGRKVVLKLTGDAAAQGKADVGHISAQIAQLKG
jgi:NADPH:quinone reductase-like Zn-dependent oxidoreductase